MTLLDKAKKVKTKYSSQAENVNKEELDLIFAYISREVSGAQMAKVVGFNPANAVTWLAYRLLKAARSGQVTVKKV